VTIAVKGLNYEYEVLVVNEFNSTRKRMSTLVRTPEGKVKLLIKGADTVIFERLAPNIGFLDETQVHLEDYANDGLRTLVLAYRDISEQEFFEWKDVYERAATQVNGRQEALDAAAEMIEKDLVLLGATAIEDKLQDGVPDTIHTLMEAGIRVWVLTGDRQETAINIGFSCKLITPDMLMLVCNEPTHFETKEFLQQKLEAVKDSMGVSSQHSTFWDRFWMGIGDDKGKFDKEAGNDIDVKSQLTLANGSCY
jgi:phospholipid-transporting ATPase